MVHWTRLTTVPKGSSLASASSRGRGHLPNNVLSAVFTFLKTPDQESLSWTCKAWMRFTRGIRATAPNRNIKPTAGVSIPCEWDDESSDEELSFSGRRIRRLEGREGVTDVVVSDMVGGELAINEDDFLRRVSLNMDGLSEKEKKKAKGGYDIDASTFSRFGYLAADLFNGATRREMCMLRMEHQMTKDGDWLDDMVASMGKGKVELGQQFLDFLPNLCYDREQVGERKLYCVNCKDIFSVGSRKALHYGNVWSHALGQHGSEFGGCVNRDKVCSCGFTFLDANDATDFAKHHRICKFDEMFKLLEKWREENPDAKSIPRNTKALDRLNTWVRGITGKRLEHGKKRKVTARQRKLLEPLVKGLSENGWEE